MKENFFGEKIKSKRKEKGKSQDEIAYVVSCSQGTICNLETGKRQPTLELAVKLSMAYEIDITDLYDASKIKIEII